MGLLVEGKWSDQWYDTKKTGGKFVRTTTQFRNWITPDGASGPTGSGGFKAESDRYHLYISLACPWAGRVTVPVLWDKKNKTIVSNESAEIMRMFNSSFNDITGNYDDYYPEELRSEIDKMNDFIYPKINNGVYKARFATNQNVYESEVRYLFDALDQLESHLSDREWLVGDRLTEADIRLFTTLVRFDSVYYGHFKCNIKRLVDYPNLWIYTKRIYNLKSISDTVNFDHIKTHYYGSHKTINPTGVVPVGPELDWTI